MNNVLEYESVMVQDNQKDRFLKLISHVQVVDEAHADAKQKLVIRLVKERGLVKKQAFLYRLTRDDGQPFNLDDLIKGRPLLESLRELRDHKGTTSTRDRLDGQNMLKYHLKEGNVANRLWVDPKTRLPVRIETVTDHPTPDCSKAVATYSGFEWDPQVAIVERLFSTDPPAGYEVEDHTNTPSVGTATVRNIEPDSPESAAVLKRLEEKVSMQFPNQIPLEHVLEYIRAATRGPSGTGIPCAFDDNGMKQAGQSRTSLVTIDTRNEPLKTSLENLLEPLGLTYEIRRGVVTITSGATGSRKGP